VVQAVQADGSFAEAASGMDWTAVVAVLGLAGLAGSAAAALAAASGAAMC